MWDMSRWQVIFLMIRVITLIIGMWQVYAESIFPGSPMVKRLLVFGGEEGGGR